MISALLPLLGTVLDKILPDDKAKAEAKLRLLELDQAGELQALAAAKSIISAEAGSEHWLVSAWRPITMLTFVAIIANNYILAPYLQLIIGESVVLEIPPDMWDLLKLGIGGYVVGRSAEKGLRTWAASKHGNG